jgi:hypothetical protein
LTTFGTFGPLLTIVQTVLKTPGSVTWEHWESGVTGRRAVFHLGLRATQWLIWLGAAFPMVMENRT